MKWFKRKQREETVLKTIAVVTFVVMVLVNALANILPINGRNTGEISDSYANLFAPIGFTFSIWGVIYVLLAGFCVYQYAKIRGTDSQVGEDALSRILPYFIASSILNTLWIFAWHYDYIGLSTLLITGMLINLGYIVHLLRAQTMTRKDYLLIRVPFSVYFGWITVAVIANITTWLVSIGWDGFGFSGSFWTIAVVAIGALIALIVTERNRDLGYLLVIMWAYFGILAKHLSDSGFDGKYESIITTLVLLLTVFAYVTYKMILQLRSLQK